MIDIREHRPVRPSDRPHNSMLTISSANELRAIDELPLRSAYELNDKSEKGIRIWRLLQISEQTRDVSLLEEAGQLLWEQVVGRPISKPEDPSSCSKEGLGDRSSFAQVITSTHFEGAEAPKRGRPRTSKYGILDRNRDATTMKNEARIVDYNVTDGKQRADGQWNSNATMPPAKRTKFTHTTSTSQDIQSTPTYLKKQTQPAAGYSAGAYSNARTTSNLPRQQVLSYDPIHLDLASHPLARRITPTDPPNTNSQPSDPTSLPSSPASHHPSGMSTLSGLIPGARWYYSQPANHERPQPYAPGNFGKYISTSFKDV
jgi:hypothetical protein